MRALKAAVVIMGVLIIVGVMFVGTVIVRRSLAPAPGAAGTRVAEMVLDEPGDGFRLTVGEAQPRPQLAGDTRALARPGQFVQVQVPGFYLRRPLSVYDWQAAENGDEPVGHA